MEQAIIFRTTPGTNHRALIVMRHPSRDCWGWFSHAGDGLNQWGFETREEAVRSARDRVEQRISNMWDDEREFYASDLEALRHPHAVLDRPADARNPWPTVGPRGQWVWV